MVNFVRRIKTIVGGVIVMFGLASSGLAARSAEELGVDLAFTAQSLTERTESAIQTARERLETFYALAPEERTFDNTPRMFDTLTAEYWYTGCACGLYVKVHPDESMRDCAKQLQLRIRNAATDMFVDRRIYQAFKEYYDNQYQTEQSTLIPEEIKYMTDSMRDFKKAGYELPDAEFEQLKAIKKELAELGQQYMVNIDKKDLFMTVPEADLDGVDPEFIASLERDASGLCILKTDHPTAGAVMPYCKKQSVRKQLYLLRNEKGYPENIGILQQIIAKRDDLAHLLGYASYAHLELDGEMVETPERAESFIRAILKRAKEKSIREHAEETRELPDGIELTSDGQLNVWDAGFVSQQYLKKNFNYDPRDVHPYFPVDSTVAGLLQIYQDFFSVRFVDEPVTGLWHESVRMISVYRNEETSSPKLLGRIVLDLYPRPGKYSHACYAPQRFARFSHDGTRLPTLGVVIANLPVATPEKPALMKGGAMTTFFHEFGHAMHAVLGATRMFEYSGIGTKTDFVEMPSQMFEQWLTDRDLVKNLSSHYKTGEKIPDHFLDIQEKLRTRSTGFGVSYQSQYALLSLAFYGPGREKDVRAIHEKLNKEAIVGIAWGDHNHKMAQFGHLVGYGARYYGYLWSEAFAHDLFEEVKKHGLRDPVIGKKLVDEVLGKGGSIDPNDLLKNFLGREPSQEPFFKNMDF